MKRMGVQTVNVIEYPIAISDELVCNVDSITSGVFDLWDIRNRPQSFIYLEMKW